jgi:ornithine cyclodeaminase/alanine dehydrogenase-like protein (mu-crystallin family)
MIRHGSGQFQILKNKTAARSRARSAPRAKTQGGLLRDVLRVSPEPYRYYTEAQVHDLLTRRPEEYVAFMKRSLVSVAHGRATLALPPKQVFADAATGGDFRVMPCELRDGGNVTKTIKLIGTNTVQRVVPDQITVGKLMVLDPTENFVAAVVEACLLSSARTGACAALAVDALARRRDQMVVIGSGRVGYYAALYGVAAAGVKRVVFCDVNAQRAREAARGLAARIPAARCEARSLDAIDATDVVVLATTSQIPLASPPAWRADLVVSLGADADTQSELDAAWGRCADLYCDTLDSLRFGDLRAWIETGVTDPAGVTDLLEVFRRPPPASNRPRVFISTGSALFDNLTARYLLEQTAP